LNLIKRIYNNSPCAIKSLIVDLYFLQKNKYRYEGIHLVPKEMTIDELLSFKRKSLTKHLVNAYDCDYWFDFLNSLKIEKVDCINRPFEVYESLPMLKKSDVVGNEHHFLNNKLSRKNLLSIATSGSTGGALKFFETQYAEQVRWGVWWRYRLDIGLNYGDKCAYFGGKSLIPIASNSPPYWIGGVLSSQLNFSVYHISESTVIDYVAKLNSFKPKWVHGYPSALYALAKLGLENSIPIKFKIDIITIGSESLLDYQKEVIELFFKARVFQHYGLSEAVANISENSSGSLSVDEDFSLVDFQRFGEQHQYKILGTNWSNAAFPLIKYDTGDVAYSKHDISDYKTNNRIVERIDGRVEDFLKMPDGKMIGRVAEVAKNSNGILESQIYQKKDYSLNIKLVTMNVYTLEDEQKYLRELAEKIGHQVNINIEYVSAIPKTANGKHRFLISEI
jgi:phenylacetate-CoA ligase